MTTLIPKRFPSSLTPPEPTPLRKQAHYAWVTAPPAEAPVRQIIYIGQLAYQSLTEQFVIDRELIVAKTAFRAHYWLEQLADIQKESLPEAIICDLTLPDGTAFELFDRIRRMPHLSSIPFLAVSSQIDPASSKQVLGYGMDDLYAYPLDRSRLETRIRFLKTYHSSLRSPTLPPPAFNDFSPSEPKRMLDVWVALIGLLMLSPLMLLIALLIKVRTGGPVLHITKCAGTGYHVFSLYKFQTMTADRMLSDGQTVRTSLGKWLRKYNLDELPQLINILRGDMSLVGNRPLPLSEAEQLTTDQWSKRFLAPAGVTGLWQIARRRKKHLSEADRHQMDIDYVDDASFWNDIRLIIKTIMILLQRSTE
ncbi:MAG: sugar transferase [Bacteroidota bacterium]